MNSYDIKTCLRIVLRRKYWVVIPALLGVLIGLAYSMTAPKIYEAKALVLVQPSWAPQHVVTPDMSPKMDLPLEIIKLETLRRTTLEKIIGEHQLFMDHRGASEMENKLQLFREMTTIEGVEDKSLNTVQSMTIAFSIAFQGQNPKKVVDVTNALVFNFLSENENKRQSRSIETSLFLANEVESIKKRLFEKEEELKLYRAKYMGTLPEQLQSSLAYLERLQGQMDQLATNLRNAENRKLVIQKQMAEPIKNPVILGLSRDADGEVVYREYFKNRGEAVDLASLKNQLASIEAKYTENHPDIIRLRKMISRIEGELSTLQSSSASVEELSGSGHELRQQFEEIELKIAGLRADIGETRSQIKMYQKKVEETPVREQEVVSLKRDYDNLKEVYRSLLEKKLEAEIATNIETQHKFQQVRVLEPATVPTIPIKPNKRVIMLLSLMLGLGLGLGFGFLREAMDTSYNTPEELEKDLDLPVLASLPMKYTVKEVRIQRVKGFLKAASVAVGFCFTAAAIILTTKGVDTTIDYVKNLVH